MTEFMRSTTGRFVITLLLGGASFVLGIVGARALDGEAPAVELEDGEVVIIGTLPETTGDFVDVLAPVVRVTAEDLAANEGKIDQITATVIAGSSGARSQIIGSVADVVVSSQDAAPGAEQQDDPGAPPQEEASPETPGSGFYTGVTGHIIPFVALAVDPCAGAEPGSRAANTSCPDGVGSTVKLTSRAFASEAVPPEPTGSILTDTFQVRGAQPTIESCPQGFGANFPTDYPTGDPNEYGSSTIGLHTTTPLETAEVRFWPVAGTVPEEGYVQEINPASHDGYEAEWTAIHQSLGSSRIVFCRNVGRHPRVTYFVDGTATDVFGRTVPLEPSILTAATAEGRPLTIANRSVTSNRFMVEAWTRAGGHVRLVDGTCDFGFRSETSGRADAEERASWVVTGVPPSPVGYADPDFSERWRWYRWVDPGESLRICAYVYASDDPFDIIGADEIILESMDELVPTVVLERVIIERGNIAEGELTIAPEGIGAGLFQAYPSGPQGSILLPETVLVDATRRIRNTGYLPDIVLTQTYTDSATNRGSQAVEEYRIPFDPFEGCGQPVGGECVEGSEYYHVVLPGSQRESSAWAKGIVTFRVDLSTVPGTGTSAAGWRYAAADDEPDSGAFAFSMRFEAPVVDRETLRTAVDVTTFTPTEREMMAIRYRPAVSGTSCEGRTVDLDSDGASKEVKVRVDGLCPGIGYSFDIQYVDHTGSLRWLPVVGLFTPKSFVGQLEVDLELSTADRSSAAISRLDVTVESLSRSLGSGCIDPIGRFDIVSSRLSIRGDSLDIVVSLDNPTAGTACGDRPSGNSQPLEARFVIPIELLTGCEADGISASVSSKVGVGTPIDVTVFAQVCIPKLPALTSQSFAAEG